MKFGRYWLGVVVWLSVKSGLVNNVVTSGFAITAVMG